MRSASCIIGGLVACGTVVFAGSSCRAPVGFGCVSDEQCRSTQGNSGVCFSVGACGYLDPACSGGYRYSEFAPKPWAGKCVVPDAAEDSTTTTTGGESTSSTTAELDSSSTSSTGAGSSSSSGPNIPVCGDGQLEGDEQCDDGNDVEADGCNTDCRTSMTVLAEFSSNLAGDDIGLDVLLTPDDDVIVGGYFGPSGNRDALLVRYQLDGREVWRQEHAGSAEQDDIIYAVTSSPSGSVRVGGQTVETPSDPEATPRADNWVAEYDGADGAQRWQFAFGDPPPGIDRTSDLVSMPDGDFVVATRVGPSSATDFGVGRYGVTPVADAFELVERWAQSFDGAGMGTDLATTVGYDTVGQRIIVAGLMRATTDDIDRHLRALDPNGDPLDPACEDFGTDDPLAADDRIHAVAVGQAGEVAAVGWATREAEEVEDAWLGYYPPGSCTPLWVSTVAGLGKARDAFNAVAIDALGHIVAGGYLNVSNGEDAFVAKYDAAGEQLWAYGPEDGPGNGTDRVEGVVIGPKREITVTGRISRPGDVDIWVLRLTP